MDSSPLPNFNTTFDIKGYTYDNFILYFAVGPRIDILIKDTEYRIDILIKDTEYYKEPGNSEIHTYNNMGLNNVMWGLKCGIEVKKQVGNLQLGLNAAWLPSFNKMYSTKIEGLHMKDRTFSIGVSLGYMLHTSKSKSLYSVKT